MAAIKKEHGYWKLNGILRDLLLECKAEDSTRYALTGIHIESGIFVATDGRRLIEIKRAHKIEPGNYFITADGYLLPCFDGKFPKYKDIVPDEKSLRKIVKITGSGDDTIGLILGELCHAGCICQLSFYAKPVELLSKAIEGEVGVFVSKESPESSPFVIKAETYASKITYIQMPVNVKNEAS